MFGNRPPFRALEAFGKIAAFQAHGHAAVVEAVLHEAAARAAEIHHPQRRTILAEELVKFLVDSFVAAVVAARLPRDEVVGRFVSDFARRLHFEAAELHRVLLNFGHRLVRSQVL